MELKDTFGKHVCNGIWRKLYDYFHFLHPFSYLY